MINQKIIGVLKEINEKLKKEKIKWCLVGSTSLVLQGIKINSKDIDILTDKKGAFKLNKLLKGYEVKPVKFGRSEFFESYRGEFQIKDIKIEVMGNLKIRVGNEWISTSERLVSPKIVKIERMKIPVSSLHKQLKVYERLGRKKDAVRVQKIKEFLSNQNP